MKGDGAAMVMRQLLYVEEKALDVVEEDVRCSDERSLFAVVRDVLGEARVSKLRRRKCGHENV